jgi:hypothetical protein
MPTPAQQRTYDLLHRIPTRGLSAAKRLSWTELNHDRVNQPLSVRDEHSRVQGSQGPQVAAREEEINALVSAAYGLTEGEIATVEESVR